MGALVPIVVWCSHFLEATLKQVNFKFIAGFELIDILVFVNGQTTKGCASTLKDAVLIKIVSDLQTVRSHEDRIEKSTNECDFLEPPIRNYYTLL